MFCSHVSDASNGEHNDLESTAQGVRFAAVKMVQVSTSLTHAGPLLDLDSHASAGLTATQAGWTELFGIIGPGSGVQHPPIRQSVQTQSRGS